MVRRSEFDQTRAVLIVVLCVAGVVIAALSVASIILTLLKDNTDTVTYRTTIHERRTIPHFSRPAFTDCAGSYTCANATDPNPTYFKWYSAATNITLLDGYFFFDSIVSGDVFDISDPVAVTLKVAGVYEFTVSAAVISLDSQPANVGVIMMSTTLPVLTNPAEGGALEVLAPSVIFGGAFIDNMHFTVVRHFEAGTVLRIVHVTSHDVVFAPSTVWTGTLLGIH